MYEVYVWKCETIIFYYTKRVLCGFLRSVLQREKREKGDIVGV